MQNLKSRHHISNCATALLYLNMPKYLINLRIINCSLMSSIALLLHVRLSFICAIHQKKYYEWLPFLSSEICQAKCQSTHSTKMRVSKSIICFPFIRKVVIRHSKRPSVRNNNNYDAAATKADRWSL